MSKGRGRGRGQGLSFNIEAIGFGRGDALPTSLLQPPPDYPPLKKRPVPLLAGEDQKYLLALQKELEKTLKSSPYCIKEEEKKHFVERYSDKYRTNNNLDNALGWEPDWENFPAELKTDVRKKRKCAKRPKLQPKISLKGAEDVVKKLEEIEKNDEKGKEAATLKKKTEEEKGSDSESVVEEVDDFEDEEENDYLTSYFDNGESYLDEEEDNIDDKEGGIY